MKTKHFSLDMKEPLKWAEIVQLVFGILCVSVSVILLITIRSIDKNEISSLTGIVFVFLFGAYQIWAGMGFTRKFITIEDDTLRIKLNPFSRLRIISFTDLIKIEVFPMNIIFILNNGSKFNLRFGTSNPERNEEIIDEISLFAERNKITFELKS